jgi:hypothetical protein
VLAALLLSACSHAPPPKPVQKQPEPVVDTRAKEQSDDFAVSGTLGTISEEQISGPFERRWDDVSRCFADAKAKSKLWYLAGKVEIKLRIDRDGRPKTAYISTSTVGNWETEHCILAIARELSFSRPHGGSEAEFTYPIEFRGKAAITPWDGARLEPAMAKHKKDVSACKKGSLPPQVMMTVYVAPGGKLTSAGFHADAPLDEAFAACLLEKSRTWKVDDPLGRIAKATVQILD